MLKITIDERGLEKAVEDLTGNLTDKKIRRAFNRAQRTQAKKLQGDMSRIVSRTVGLKAKDARTRIKLKMKPWVIELSSGHGFDHPPAWPYFRARGKGKGKPKIAPILSGTFGHKATHPTAFWSSSRTTYFWRTGPGTSAPLDILRVPGKISDAYHGPAAAQAVSDRIHKTIRMTYGLLNDWAR